jgi:hypothetical protein
MEERFGSASFSKVPIKSSKKTELYPNAKNGGYLKLPQSVRLRFSSSGKVLKPLFSSIYSDILSLSWFVAVWDEVWLL